MKFKQKHIPLSVVRDWRDPMYPNTAVQEWCHLHNVLFQAFSPLGGQRLAATEGTANPIMMDPTLFRIAMEHELMIAQVVIRWNIMRGVGVVFRSGDMDHLMEILETFDHKKLSDQDLVDIEHIQAPDFPAKQKQDEVKTVVYNNPGMKREKKIFYGTLPPDSPPKKKEEKEESDNTDSVELQDEL